MIRFTLATVNLSSGPAAAIGVGEGYYLLSEFMPLLTGVSVKELLEDWQTSFHLLEEIAASVTKGATGKTFIDSQNLLTPMMYPNKLMAVGANYSGHLREMGLEEKKWTPMPFFFRPPNTTLVGPGETVSIPKSTQQFDWECELAVVVGKRLKNASLEEASEAIAGYSIGLDLSCRDLIRVDNDLKVDLVRGKAQDTMAPCGPHIVPKQFMPDINDLKIELFVNEVKMMDASTSEMLFKVNEMLSVISEFVTVDPGDIVFTGSPAGSAVHHGNRWLRPGDRIRAEIEGIGSLNVAIRHD